MKRRLAIWLCIIGGIVAALIYLTGTRGGLAEFSPYTLECRFQSEFTVGFGMWPVYRSAPREHSNEMIAFLLEEGFVTPVQAETERWEPIFHWNHAWRDGYGVLYHVVVRNRQEIMDWSKADPERARIYWAEGFEFLRSDQKTDICTGREILLRGWRCESIPELTEFIAATKKEVRELFEQPLP